MYVLYGAQEGSGVYVIAHLLYWSLNILHSGLTEMHSFLFFFSLVISECKYAFILLDLLL